MRDNRKKRGRENQASPSRLLLPTEVRATLTEFALEVLSRGTPTEACLEELVDRYSLALDHRLDPRAGSSSPWCGGSASA